MANTQENFIDWALHPDRTLEERFGVEILIEQTERLCSKMDGLPHQSDYETGRLARKQRALDPAHRPEYHRNQLKRVARILPELTAFDTSHFDDRPICDISFLRFCPALVCVRVHHSQIHDWSPLTALPALIELDISDQTVRDLRIIGDLTGLQILSLWLHAPWPDLRGLDRLVNLLSLKFHGNVLALEVIPSLIAVRMASIRHGGGFNVPLRNMNDLPDMPQLRCLDLVNTTELHGIERYPNLLNLKIYGYHSDLTPLAALHHLTHLFLAGGQYPDLVPISSLSALCRLTLCINLPPDLTPLADCPRLHEIVLEDSPVVPAELASLNSLAASWDDEFASPVKRPLAPLRLRIRHPKITSEDDPPELVPGLTPRDWGEDTEMGKSEDRWFIRKTNRRLTKLLGKGWGSESDRFPGPPGNMHVTITRPEDIDRLPAIANTLRKIIASARHRWTYVLVVDSLARFERELDELEERDEDEFDAESERQDWEYHRMRKQERMEFLQRKYRHQLSLETGIPLPPPDPATTTGAAADFAHAAAENPEPEYDLGTNLHLYAVLTEHAAIIYDRDRELAEMLFETHAEPPPPEA